MTDGVLIPNAEQQFFDLTGEPLSGGLVYTYVVGTTTPKVTFVDQGQTTPNTNPIVLDSLGRCVIWGAGSYRQVVTDAAGNQIWDQVTSDGGIGDINADLVVLQDDIDTLQTDVSDLQTAVLSGKTFLDKIKTPVGTAYICTALDSGTTFFSSQAGATITFVLPSTTSIPRGWYAFFVRENWPLVIAVNGGIGELIEGPPTARAAVPVADFDWENMLISFDGSNFQIVSATPRTWALLGTTSFPQTVYNAVQFGTGNHTISIPAKNLKFTLVGGGGAGGGGNAATASGGGGGAGAVGIVFLGGLTIGNTLTLQVAPGGVGTAGLDGQMGGATALVSGTEVITSAVAGGGAGGASGDNGGVGGLGGSVVGATLATNGNRGGHSYNVLVPGSGSLGSWGFFGAGGDGSLAQSPLVAGNGGNDGVALLEWFTLL